MAVYVVYNQQHLINTLKQVWLQRFFLRPIDVLVDVDNILANFMGSTIMTISCLFSMIEGRCWPSCVRTASGEGHYWLHASVGSLLHEEMWFISRFLSRSLGWSQRDAHLRGWALGHWWPCFFLGGGIWLAWRHQSSIVWCWFLQIHRTQCAYLICIYLSLPPVPYITSLKPRTDYSFVQNGSDVKGATWEPDECLPISLDHIRLRLKLDWVETLFQYLTARNTIYYLIYVALMIPFFKC